MAALEMIKIDAVEPRVVAVPLKRPFHMSGEIVTAAHNLVVKITDSDGVVGWGEAASAPMMTGETAPALLAAAKFMIPGLIGAEIGLGDLTQKTDALIYHNHGAKAALRIAVMDLLGRKQGRPVFDLLGGRRRDRAGALILLASGGEDERGQVRRLVDDGVLALKIKVGSATVDQDLERALMVRQAAGPDIRISADANMAFDRAQGIQFMQGADSAGLDFVEQPVAGDDIAAMRACADASPVPLCVDEGLHGLADIERHHASGAAHGGNLKLIKLGGLTQAVTAAQLLDDLGMKINIAGKVAETSLASAAALHLSAAVPSLDWDLSLTNQYLAEDIVGNPLVLEDGHFKLSDRPGLGVDVDLVKLDQFSVLT